MDRNGRALIFARGSWLGAFATVVQCSTDQHDTGAGAAGDTCISDVFSTCAPFPLYFHLGAMPVSITGAFPSSPQNAAAWQQTLHTGYPSYETAHLPPAQTNAVACLNNHPIYESEKCTSDLAGTTLVEAVCMEYKERSALMFIFSDLSVKTEGVFVLRYRALSVMSHTHVQEHDSTSPIPVLAECWGIPFRVYGTKEFPGLRASTDLTKHISRFGVRLCTCEQERMHRLKDRAAPRKNASRRLPVPKPVVAAATTPVFAVAPQAHPDGSGASFRT
ncbi:hypothetical protein AcV5_002763 [Taiwanofungus camphoratus]|nr:hypothetical protein AcV5_002763 [Antrodia cinnamomea]KAI0925010.1 hypothetical protein AcW2_005717 [Antrodia cinnamomea]